MGIFKKIFKGIGSGFKWIGRKIMKGFRSVGKFINKLGIFGQIGMALLMPGIMNAAFGALSSMGSGFMAALNTAAQAGSGIAKVTHAVLQGALTAGKTLAGALRSVTETVVGTVTDSLRLVGNKVTGAVLKPENMFYIDPVKSVGITLEAAGKVGFTPPLQGTSWKAQLSRLGENTVQRLESGVSKFATGSRDVGRIVTGEHVPDYQRFTVDGKSVLRDKNLLSNQPAWQKSPEYWMESAKGKEWLKTPEGIEAYKKHVGSQPSVYAPTLKEAGEIDFTPEVLSGDQAIPVGERDYMNPDMSWMKEYAPGSQVKTGGKQTFAGRIASGFSSESLGNRAKTQAASLAMQAMAEPPPGERLISPYGFPVTDNTRRMAQAAASEGFGVPLRGEEPWPGYIQPIDLVASSNELLGFEDGQADTNFYDFQNHLNDIYNKQGIIS